MASIFDHYAILGALSIDYSKLTVIDYSCRNFARTCQRLERLVLEDFKRVLGSPSRQRGSGRDHC